MAKKTKTPRSLQLWREFVYGSHEYAPARRQRMAKLGIILNRHIAEQLVEEGVIDRRGKSDDQLQEEVLNRIERLLVGGLEFKSRIIDHRSDLFREARRFVRRKKFEFAVLSYATYFPRRTSYVHYKWTPESTDGSHAEAAMYTWLLRAAENAVARLRSIENRPFAGKKRVPVPAMSRKQIAEADKRLQELYALIRATGDVPKELIPGLSQ